MALLLSACSGKKDFSTENDTLRAQIMDLQEQVDRLQRRNRELESELQSASTVSESLPAEVRQAIPHPAELSIGRLSHARDTDQDGKVDELLIYLQPRDGMGRMIPLVGELSLNAAILPAKGDAATIGRVSLNPLQLRDAYRAGITGTHYTVQVPIKPPPDLSDSEVIVRAIFTDGQTGQILTAERSIPLRQSSPG
jgi:hypothetical protein